MHARFALDKRVLRLFNTARHAEAPTKRRRTEDAGLAELVDALDSKSSSKECGFESHSRYAQPTTTQVPYMQAPAALLASATCLPRHRLVEAGSRRSPESHGDALAETGQRRRKRDLFAKPREDGQLNYPPQARTASRRASFLLSLCIVIQTNKNPFFLA